MVEEIMEAYMHGYVNKLKRKKGEYNYTSVADRKSVGILLCFMRLQPPLDRCHQTDPAFNLNHYLSARDTHSHGDPSVRCS